ncbi:hypothetical protein L195_g052193, partial [Trifolium pratense]
SDDRVVLLPPMNGCGSDESLPSGDSRLYSKSKEVVRVRVPDTTVISSLSSIVDPREHIDLAVCECRE